MDNRYKLTESNVIDIKERIAAGERHKSIADYYQVNMSTISKIKNNVLWKDVQIDVQFEKYKNFWSHHSPELSKKIIQYYQDGYNQEEVSEILNQYILNIDYKIRPKQVNQGMIHDILKENKVKPRRRTVKYIYFIDQINRLKKTGLNIKDIGLQLGIPACTVGRYLRNEGL